MTFYTILGIIAIVIWSTNMGFSRILIEQLGGFLCCGIEMTTSGLLLMLFYLIRKKTVKPMFKMPVKYLLVCGALFLAYSVTFYWAMHLCENRSQVLVVSALNYIWPIMTIVFGIPVLKRRCRAFSFFGGIILTVVGTFGVSLGVSGSTILGEMTGKIVFAYCLSFAGAIFWGLYSCSVTYFLADRPDDINSLPLFMLNSGILMLLIGLWINPNPVITDSLIPPLVYTIVFPGMLAYWFWDLGIQKGNALLVSFSSLFTVVLSILASSVVLKIQISLKTFLFCLMITLGAILCKFSEKNKSEPV